MGEVADLFASLGLHINEEEWRKGETKISEVSKALDGAFRDKQGRWRAASGRFLTMKEKAEGAAAGIMGMGAAAESAGKKASEAGHKGAAAFDGMGTAIKGYLVYLAGHAGYERLIKFNQQVQDAKISLSAMLQGNMGSDWKTATKNADDLYQEFQRFSQTTPVTTQQMLEFGRGVAVATFQAGGKIADLTTITEMGTVAAKTLGANSQYAALELTEMLQGNVSRRMRFAQQLLGMAHVTEEQFRELNGKQRLAVVTKVLTSEPMRNANAAMSASFSGVTSTLEDKLQITFGKIGKPLFDRITAAVKAFNDWLDENAVKIEQVGAVIGNVLVVAFDALVIAVNAVAAGFRFLINQSDIVIPILISLALYFTALGVEAAIAGVEAAAAWIAVAWPVLAVIAAVAALVYAFLYLRKHPEAIRKAFEAMRDGIGAAIDWIVDRIKAIAVRIEDFFTEDIPDAIKAAFEALADLPIIKQLIELVNAIEGAAAMEGMNKDRSSMPKEDFDAKYPDASQLMIDPYTYIQKLKLQSSQPSAMLAPGSAGGAGGGVQIGQVNVGDINVHSTSADPAAVAAEAKKVFHQELGGVLRQTMDAV